MVISWCGMRGIVTLATALALPEDFAQRDLIVFCAFWVVLGTLALQGLTLRPLMQRLKLPEDTSVEQETRLARQATAQAAMQVLQHYAQSQPESEAGRLLYLEYAARAAGGADVQTRDGTLPWLQERALAVQRQTLLNLRRNGTIGDDAYHIIEEELDIIELTANSRVRTMETPDKRGCRLSASLPKRIPRPLVPTNSGASYPDGPRRWLFRQVRRAWAWRGGRVPKKTPGISPA